MQLPPVRTWGEHYVAARTAPRGDEPEVWRFLAARDGTVVSLVPSVAVIPVLDEGELFEIEAPGDFEIFANKPILVGQFLASSQAPGPGVHTGDAGIGDPAFSIGVPVEQFRSDYVFLAAPKFVGSFVTAVVPTGVSLTLDGMVVEDAGTPVGTGEFSNVTLAVSEGAHQIHAEAPFGITVYGFDNYVSYAYPGGMNLEDLKHVTVPDGL